MTLMNKVTSDFEHSNILKISYNIYIYIYIYSKISLAEFFKDIETERTPKFFCCRICYIRTIFHAHGLQVIEAATLW